MSVIQYTKNYEAIIPSLAKLSMGSEFSSYREPQWRFLLGGGDVSAVFVVVPDDDNNEDQHPNSESESKNNNDKQKNDEGNNHSEQEKKEFLGCLLQISLGDNDDDSFNNAGYGMMLVDPKARGQGLARKLLNAGIVHNNKVGGRKVLAVCTPKGQGVYRKLGFQDAGRVAMITTTTSSIIATSNAKSGGDKNLVTEESSIHINTYTPSEQQQCSITNDEKKICDIFVDMDKRATGYDRTKRLTSLMTNAIVGTVTDKDSSNIIAIAAIRQDCAEGPITVGPIIGGEVQVVMPLVKSLVDRHLSETKKTANEVEKGDTNVSLLISDHKELVDQLVGKEGYSAQIFDYPAMTMDGNPIYQNGDGTYIGLIHPTLG